MQRISILAIGSLVVVLCAPAIAQPAWDIVPFQPGSGRVSILIDTTPLQSDDVLESAGLTVRFVGSGNKLIGSQYYQLVPPGQGLGAGKVYQINLTHGYASATGIDATGMDYETHVLGGKADGIPAKAKRGVSRSAQIVMGGPAVGATPAVGALVPSPQLAKRCAAYADMAKAANATNRARGCGIPQSNQWNDQFSRHYSWCLTAPPSEVESETNSRSRQLLARCPQ